MEYGGLVQEPHSVEGKLVGQNFVHFLKFLEILLIRESKAGNLCDVGFDQSVVLWRLIVETHDSIC